MPYSTDQDLLTELGQFELARLTGDPTGAAVDAQRTELARQNGDAIIDATLRSRYKSGTVQGDTLLRSISVDLTVYYLSEYRYRDSVVPPGAIRRRSNALELLGSIALGELPLEGSSP